MLKMLNNSKILENDQKGLIKIYENNIPHNIANIRLKCVAFV